jgi:hypothetical protein
MAAFRQIGLLLAIGQAELRLGMKSTTADIRGA